MMRRLLLFFILLATVSGCQPKQKTVPVIHVTAFCTSLQTIPADSEFIGVTKSSHLVEIRSRVEGYLDKIAYTEGSMVEKDTLLFQIDPRSFIATLIAAQGSLAQQEASLWRAKRSLERIEPLYKQNAASQKDLDDATTQVLTSEAAVIEAKSRVVQAELDLSYTQITSPIKGLTGRSLYREGTLITPSINGLLTYVSIVDPIWVYFSISDNDLLTGRAEGMANKLILPPQKEFAVTLVLADGSQYPYTGKVNFTSPQLDPQTGTLAVRAQFDNPESALIPGQFVRAIVTGALRPNALVVPQEAVFQGNKGMYVFVIGSDNKVEMRQIQPGVWYNNYWVINSGLEPGDLVVAEGVNKLQNGALVHIDSITSYSEKTQNTGSG